MACFVTEKTNGENKGGKSQIWTPFCCIFYLHALIRIFHNFSPPVISMGNLKSFFFLSRRYRKTAKPLATHTSRSTRPWNWRTQMDRLQIFPWTSPRNWGKPAFGVNWPREIKTTQNPNRKLLFIINWFSHYKLRIPLDSWIPQTKRTARRTRLKNACQ